MNKRSKNVGRLFIFLITILIIIKIFSHFYVNYQWFKDLGYTQLFTIPLITKILMFLAIFAVSFTFFYLSAMYVIKIINKSGYGSKSTTRTYSIIYGFDEFEDNIIEINNDKPVSKSILVIAAGVLSAIVSGIFLDADAFIKFLQFINSNNFGVIDPVFSKDASFYVFKLPFINLILDIMLLILSIILILSIVLFVMFRVAQIHLIFRRGDPFLPSDALKFLATVLGIWFIVFAVNKYFSMYSIMYSQVGYVFGAGNTDINIGIPLTKLLAVLSLIIGIICLTYNFNTNNRLVISAVGVYIVIAIFSEIVHYSYQHFYVANNEFVAEKPYINHELKFTKIAYGLNNIKIKEYPGITNLTVQNIENNQATMENIRLNDPKVLRQVLSQNQGLRYYYHFGDIDVDRYNLDGNYKQVMITAREIDEKSLSGKAGTFINQTMRYTHGYGVVATLANDFDENGYAQLIIRDVPPQSSIKNLEVKEPRIYFGEKTNDEKYGFVIGNTTAKEFDYPQGETNIENVYQGKTGLALKGLNKLALSFYFNTLRFYLAGEVKSDSKLLMRRNIKERVNELMPYLYYDNDPYIVVAQDGKLYWIIDAYTVSNMFPYSMPVIENVNYIRNSVKVVVDAYNGTVDFYVFEDEPVVKILKNAFPNVFKSADQMPSNLKEHIRYPEDLFRIQSEVLKDFHVEDTLVFYNKEDTWQIAKKAEGNKTSYVEPYYTVMKLPDEEKEEFILMIPYTPVSRGEQQRNNLVAWLAARNDASKYGQLVLYKMPKNVEVQGPLMIDSLIDQDPEISSKMTLWGQGGSKIIRGNLLVVPIDGGFIYVEPIYIEADRQGGSIPQLQAIVFAIDKKITMIETNNLDEAVAKFFSKKVGTSTVVKDVPANINDKTTISKEDIIEQIRKLKQQLEKLENDLKNLQ